MANHPSAVKRHHQSVKRQARNHATKSALRGAIRRTREAIGSGDAKLAEKCLREAESLVAKAASKGVLHKRNASRKISRLASAVSKKSK